METLVGSCKESAVWGMEHFIKVFSFVPEEKLNWTPFPSAKSAMQIAAHTAIYAGVFAKMMRDRKLPKGDEIPGFVARNNAAAYAISSRAEMESAFRKGTEEVIAALDALTPEAIGLTLDSGLGWTMPMTFLMKLPGVHAIGHTAQIDYLQTCWDDQDVHF
jgi:hypothetical protein